jgi:glycosyltransferase involved in cell wall biosynthesis
MPTISVIIPTYNRPEELGNCIKSILEQTEVPHELIIVDDGNLSGLSFEKKCKDTGIEYIHLKKTKRGLTESRNAGVKRAGGDIIFFFDDDVILSPNYIEEILKVYEDDAKGVIGGVGGIITNCKPVTFKAKLVRIYDILFLMSGFKEGKVLPSGFCTNFGKTGSPIDKLKEVDFFSGCNMSFLKDVFRNFAFDTQNFQKYGLGEDKDFSYRVSRKYKLLITPKAKLMHLHSEKMRDDLSSIEWMFIMFTYRFFRLYVAKDWWSWLFFYYSISGYILFRIVISLCRPNKKNISQSMGIFFGIRDIIKNKR